MNKIKNTRIEKVKQGNFFKKILCFIFGHKKFIPEKPKVQQDIFIIGSHFNPNSNNFIEVSFQIGKYTISTYTYYNLCEKCKCIYLEKSEKVLQTIEEPYSSEEMLIQEIIK